MVAWREPIFIVRSAHGLMARTCAGKGPLQAVALYFRLVPVFPALREYASPHERARLFPAVRVERMKAQRSSRDIKNPVETFYGN